MKLCRVVLLTFGAVLLLLSATAHAASGRHVDVIKLNADINPVTADYVVRGINQANSDGASAVIIELDTPGGDLASMTKIIERMESSSVPTMVYVYPAGAWAGSAGTFITVASDIAAMAPGTAIGAASPVGSGGATLGKTERAKVTNFAASYIEALARDHGHNTKFAVRAVRGAVAIGYHKALNHHVVNFIAMDLHHLLNKANGVSVKTPSGIVTFHTANAAINYINMDWTENLLLLLSDPNLVLILMSVGTLAIIFELSSPGAILPGIVGVLCLAIAFYALGIIPVNAAGLVLMAFAILLFVADIKMPTHGFLTVGGIISFALGAVLLFSPSGVSGGPSISPWAVVFVTALMAGFFAFVVRKALKAQEWSVKTGSESLVGTTAITQSRLNPVGMVFLDGALWKAVSDKGPVEQGEEVRVLRIDGLSVHVVSLEAPEQGVTQSKQPSEVEATQSKQPSEPQPI